MSAQVFQFREFQCKESTCSQLAETCLGAIAQSPGPAHQSAFLRIGYIDRYREPQTMTLSASSAIHLSTTDPVAEQMFIAHLEGILALIGGRLDSLVRVSSLHIEMALPCQEAGDDIRHERSIA